MIFTSTLKEELPMASRSCRSVVLSRLLLMLVGCLAAFPCGVHADLMIIGNDQKVVWDAEGNRKFVAPGKDTISVVDITDREAPKILVSLPLHVGNFIDSNVSILKVDGTAITDTGKKLTLPGQPASMRGRAR